MNKSSTFLAGHTYCVNISISTRNHPLRPMVISSRTRGSTGPLSRAYRSTLSLYIIHRSCFYSNAYAELCAATQRQLLIGISIESFLAMGWERLSWEFMWRVTIFWQDVIETNGNQSWRALYSAFINWKSRLAVCFACMEVIMMSSQCWQTNSHSTSNLSSYSLPFGGASNGQPLKPFRRHSRTDNGANRSYQRITRVWHTNYAPHITSSSVCWKQDTILDNHGPSLCRHI